MILTCPECATSYFVDDLRIPRGGRMVKCTTCGVRWRAFQDRSPEPGEPADVGVRGAPSPAQEASPDLNTEVPDLPPRSRRKAEPDKKKAPRGLIVGLSVLGVVTVALAAGVILRQQVVGLVPGAAPLFAAIGLPVNTLGLVVEAKSQPGFQAGRPILSITGSIRNVNKSSTDAPPIRISLLDANGKTVGGMVAQPLNGKIPPGAIRYFAVTMPDPPASARALDIVFEPAVEPKSTAEPHSAKAAPSHAEAAPHTPAPVEAKPLPADSPDALKTHEQH